MEKDVMQREMTVASKEKETSEKEIKEEAIRENRIKDETVVNLGILSQLKLSKEEREQVKGDLEKMLNYFDQLKMLDTQGVEPMIYGASPGENVFREDTVINGDGLDAALYNAPSVREGMFQVPRTVGREGL